MKYCYRIGVFIVLSCFSSATLADEMETMLIEVEERLANNSLRQQAISLGKDRALLCGYCHGEDGNSVRKDIPNLAGQNPAYLLQQINHFATGQRKDYVMNSLASKFSSDEQINLTIFYATRKTKPVLVDQKLARLGKGLYQTNCQSCHGEDAQGKQDFARLAGQNEAYTIKTLQRFRGNAMKQAMIDKAKRRSLLMESVSSKLSDQEIKQLAAYLAQLR